MGPKHFFFTKLWTLKHFGIWGKKKTRFILTKLMKILVVLTMTHLNLGLGVICAAVKGKGSHMQPNHLG